MCMPTKLKPTLANCSSHKYEQEKNYILNRCLEYDWERVEEHCALLVDTFRSESILQKEKNDKTCDGRKQLLATDQWGNTPLHAACHHKPPRSTINAILKAISMIPGGTSQVLLMKNSRNSTPLSIACETGASQEVIHELLYPQNGLVGSGSVVSVADNQGMTPILGVMMRYEVLHHVPVIDDLCLRKLNFVSDNPVSISTGMHDAATASDASFSNVQGKMFKQSLTTVDALIRAAWWSSVVNDTNNDYGSSAVDPCMLTENYISIIHGAAKIAECIPPNLTDLILRNYQGSISTEDQIAVRPLHLAVMADHVSHPSQKDSIRWQFLYNRKYFIDRLLQIDPSSATGIVPHHRGRSLFCQAIDSGLYWHIQINTSSTASDHRALEGDHIEIGNSSTKGPLQSLWMCAPQALYSKDPETSLYPFMLAATVQTPSQPTSSTSLSHENSTEDILQLDTIYNLLRLYPQAMKNALECD